MAQRLEHFEYDRVVQSDDRPGCESDDGAASDRRAAVRNSFPWIRLLSFSALCVLLLLAWGISHQGENAMVETSSGEEEEEPPLSDQVASSEPSAEKDRTEPSYDNVDIDDESSSAQPVFVTKTTVKELHGNIPNSFYDPSPGTGTSETTCAKRGIERGYVCIGDRVGNEERLGLGTMMCSHHGQYMFGMDESGSLVWRDCFQDEGKVYYEGEGGNYFFMRENAAFVVSGNEGDVKWERECKFEVHPTPWCLGKPAYDCPYLHLHSEGKLVLNWIDDSGRWKSKDALKLYNFH